MKATQSWSQIRPPHSSAISVKDRKRGTSYFN